MDGTGGQREQMSSRAPSRTSTTSSHSHRHHHAHYGTSNSPSSQPSSLLQERIQQRRAEKKMSEGNLSSTTGRSRDGDHIIRSSPSRRSTTATVQRAKSNTEEDGLDGMGMKEIEKTIETLKKQNWDLKLELYHRRERQTALEEQTKRLQDEHGSMLLQRNETMKLYDDLVVELDRRDKAMFEAIDMIVDLQSTLDAVEHDKEMVRIVEAGLRQSSTTPSAVSPEQSFRMESPQIQLSTEPPARLGDQRTLERMSSFLSERGERTANLRDVVLNNKSSYFHMRKVSEASADPSEANRIASPSLSVLSESSFMSVYGRNKTTPDNMPSPPELEEPVAPIKMKKLEISHRPGDESGNEQRSGNAPSRRASAASKGGASLIAQMQSLNTIVDVKSQLRHIERVDTALSDDGASRPSTSSQGKVASAPPLSRNRSQIRTKQETRESLREIITTPPYGNDFANARMLPPTPDTTSSSMLRRQQHSNDTLPGDPRITPKDSFVNEMQAPAVAALLPQLPPKLARGNFSHLSPIPVVAGHQALGRLRETSGVPRVNQPRLTLPARPRSADETTISRHRADSWGSETDSDGGADAHSEASDIDYWMRESNKPDGLTANARQSPDLFSFPAESGRWETDAIFGAMRGTGFMGSPAPDLRRDPMDQIPITIVEPRNGIYHAPNPSARDGGIDSPPQRRSSRSARTSSMTGGSIHPDVGKPKKLASRSSSATYTLARTRRSSIDSANVHQPGGRPETGFQTDGAGFPRKAQYPPIAGQPTRQRKSGALNRLFRRSIGSGQDAQELTPGATESQVAAQQTPPAHMRGRVAPAAGRTIVPPSPVMPWKAPPAGFHDHLTSATPPPIMRSRASSAQPNMDRIGNSPMTPRYVEVGEPDLDGEDQAMESGSAENTPQNGRRRWLGLGRRTSVKNRNV